MLFFLAGDTLDTVYRFVVIGYLGEGAAFPGVGRAIKPDTLDLVVFLIAQVGIVIGIYNLYKLKKVGGYYFLGSNFVFLFYASLFGPVAEVGILNIIVPIFFYFALYVFFAICIPWLYSEKFN